MDWGGKDELSGAQVIITPPITVPGTALILKGHVERGGSGGHGNGGRPGAVALFRHGGINDQPVPAIVAPMHGHAARARGQRATIDDGDRRTGDRWTGSGRDRLDETRTHRQIVVAPAVIIPATTLIFVGRIERGGSGGHGNGGRPGAVALFRHRSIRGPIPAVITPMHDHTARTGGQRTTIDNGSA
jgi:hypothetical protein